MHPLGGSFLLFCSTMYFVLLPSSNYFKINNNLSKILQVAFFAAMFFAGHRSAFLGLIAAYLVWIYFNGLKNAAKRLVPIATLGIVVVALMSFYNPSVIIKSLERASTTFDTKQSTYQGRWYNALEIIKVSFKQHPILGSPIKAKKSHLLTPIKIKSGNIKYTRQEVLVTPHNLIVEWLWYYGIVGVFAGLVVLITSFKTILKFLRTYRLNQKKFDLGVSLFCAWIFNLVMALTNAFVGHHFNVFFMYFPMVFLLAVDGVERKVPAPTEG